MEDNSCRLQCAVRGEGSLERSLRQGAQQLLLLFKKLPQARFSSLCALGYFDTIGTATGMDETPSPLGARGILPAERTDFKAA